MNLWPPQINGLRLTAEAEARGVRRILFTLPTGGGKSRCMREMMLAEAGKVTLYTNRRMLLDQTRATLESAGIECGIRAAGFKRDPKARIQVGMIQTEAARREKWPMHEAARVLVDEVHLQCGARDRSVIARHWKPGCVVVGFTATPIGCAEMYDELVVAGTNSELRACGALVPAIQYAPDEPDLRHVGRQTLGEDFTEDQNRKAIMVHGVFGRVLSHYKRLNPDRRPALLFAPGVPESIWFAEQFFAQGITAAHIDGDNCWINGEYHDSSPDVRRQIMDGSKDGSIKVVCNRFVLREGIDAPWMYHGIFATMFGSLQSFLQSGGRLLRASPGKTEAIIQDHGGSVRRLGSLNADRVWDLKYTAAQYVGMYHDEMRGGSKTEPFTCPKCALLLTGRVCRCGFTVGRRSRVVVQADGSLREIHGEEFKPVKVLSASEEAQKAWERCYYRCLKSKKPMTFRQAYGLFYQENGSYPPPGSKLMPRRKVDEWLSVKDVPKTELI